MRLLSDLAIQAIYAANTAEVFLLLLEISHSSIATKRYVNSRTAVTSNSNTYQPRGFVAVLPSEQSGQVPKINLTIDNVDREISDLIRGLPANASPAVAATLSVVLKSQPDTIEVGPFNFTLKDSNYDAGVGVLVLSHEDFQNLSFPGLNFSIQEYPGLFGVS